LGRVNPQRLGPGLRGVCGLAVLVLASAASCQRQAPPVEKAADPPAAASAPAPAPPSAPAAPDPAAAAPAATAAPAASPFFARCREAIAKEAHYAKPLTGDSQPIVDNGYESFLLHGADQDFFTCEVAPDHSYTIKAAYGGRRPFVDVAHGKF